MIKLTQPDKCPHCGSTNNPWLSLIDRDTRWWDCCDATQPFTLKDVVLEVGKYKGLTLEELDDAGYLAWLKKVGQEKKDDFLLYCLSLKV